MMERLESRLTSQETIRRIHFIGRDNDGENWSCPSPLSTYTEDDKKRGTLDLAAVQFTVTAQSTLPMCVLINDDSNGVPCLKEHI